MAFDARLKAYRQAVFPGMGGGYGSNWATWGGWGTILPRTRFDYAREVGDGSGSSVVMAICAWIARTFPEAPLQVLDAKGEVVPAHPLLDLLDNPNPFYDGLLLWMATLIDYTVSGNAYWLKVRGAYGRVVELWYAPQWMIQPRWPADGSAYIDHYDYVPLARPIRVEPEDIVHFRFGIDPNNTRKGLSPLASVLREIFTDDEAANFTGSLLRNLGVPGVIISPDTNDGGMTPEEAEGVKAKFEQKFGGDQRGRALVLEGPAKVAVLSFSPDQMNLKELRRIPEERVAAVLGIHPMVVGLGAGLDRSTLNNMEEARQAAYESNIIPTQRILGSALRRQLLRDFSDPARHKIGFDLSEVRVLQPDQDALYTRLNKAVQGGWLTIAEARKAANWEVKAEHEVYVFTRGATLVPAGYLDGLDQPFDTAHPPAALGAQTPTTPPAVPVDPNAAVPVVNEALATVHALIDPALAIKDGAFAGVNGYRGEGV